MSKPIHLMLCSSCLALLLSWAGALAETSQILHLSRLYVTNRPPPNLMAAYMRLIQAMKSGDEAVISRLCKPDTIRIISTPRPERAGEDGAAKEISLPFAREHLDVKIILVRKDSDQQYLLRTTTTAFWFTKTADGQWQLTDYLDKPIE